MREELNPTNLSVNGISGSSGMWVLRRIWLEQPGPTRGMRVNSGSGFLPFAHFLPCVPPVENPAFQIRDVHKTQKKKKTNKKHRPKTSRAENYDWLSVDPGSQKLRHMDRTWYT